MKANVFMAAAISLLAFGCARKETFDEAKDRALAAVATDASQRNQDHPEFKGGRISIIASDLNGYLEVYDVKRSDPTRPACVSYRVNISPRNLNEAPYVSDILSTC